MSSLWIGPLLASSLWAARAAAQTPYDYRLHPRYDPATMQWAVRELRYRFETETGRVLRPDGTPVTAEDALTPFRNVGPGRLSGQLEALLVSRGMRLDRDPERGWILPPDFDAPLPRFDVELLAAAAAAGKLPDGAAPADPSEFGPEALEAFGRHSGWRVEGGRLLDRSGRTVTQRDVLRLSERVPAEESPLLAELLRRALGASPAPLDGGRFLATAEGEPVGRDWCLASAAAYGLDPSEALDAPFRPRPPFMPAELLRALRGLGLEVSADGRATWQGRVLTHRRYLALIAPLDFKRLEPRDASLARLAAKILLDGGGALRQEGGRELLYAKDGTQPFNLASAVRLLAASGLQGQKGLDAPLDALGVGFSNEQRRALQLVGAELARDGSVLWQGETLTVRAYLRFARPADPDRAGLSPDIAARYGLVRREVEGRLRWVTAAGTVVTNLQAARVRDHAELSPATLGLLDSLARRQPPGPLAPESLGRIRDAVRSVPLPETLRAALDKKNGLTAEELSARVREAAQRAARVKAGSIALSAAAPPTPAVPSRGRVPLPPAQARLSGLLRQSLHQVLLEESGSFTARLLEGLREPRTGELELPEVTIGDRRTDALAWYSSDTHEIAFEPRFVESAAVEASLDASSEELSSEARKRLAARFSQPASLRRALEEDAELRQRVARSIAETYVHELGHAVSARAGPASGGPVDGLGDGQLDEQRYAELWAMRFVHAALQKDPGAEVRERYLASYRRLVSDFPSWQAGMQEDFRRWTRDRELVLSEARAIQGRWASRLAQLVPEYGPGVAEEVARLRRGNREGLRREGKYREELERFRREELPALQVEGALALAARKTGEPGSPAMADSLAYRARAVERFLSLAAEPGASSKERDRLRRRVPSPSALGKEVYAHIRLPGRRASASEGRLLDVLHALGPAIEEASRRGEPLVGHPRAASALASWYRGMRESTLQPSNGR